MFVIWSLLLLWSGTASAQGQEEAGPFPLLDAPPAAPTEERLEPRAVEPFFLPEMPGARTVMQGVVPELRSSVLAPPAVLQEVTRPRRLLRLGPFAILPSAAAAVAYDDNVNATRTDREDGITGIFSGSLRAQSLFERHSLGFQADVTSTPFDRDDEALFDWVVSADGRLDLTPRSSLSAAARFTRGTESAESAETGEEPTVQNVAGTIAYAQRLRRLRWTIDAGINRFDAQDGAEVNVRDRTSYSMGVGADYALSRRIGVFAESGYALNDFDVAGEGGSRDSQFIGGSMGARFALGRTLSARLGVGYSTIFFDDPARDNRQSFTGRAALDGGIRLDRITLVSLGLDHSTGLTTVDDAALVTRTRLSASIRRSLSPVSAIMASVAYARSDFLDIRRTDNDVISQLAYSRTVARNVALNISYRFSQRFSDEEENEFYRNVISLGLSASF